MLFGICHLNGLIVMSRDLHIAKSHTGIGNQSSDRAEFYFFIGQLLTRDLIGATNSFLRGMMLLRPSPINAHTSSICLCTTKNTFSGPEVIKHFHTQLN